MIALIRNEQTRDHPMLPKEGVANDVPTIDGFSGYNAEQGQVLGHWNRAVAQVVKDNNDFV